MTYQRKTRDCWDVEGNCGPGWECVTGAETWTEVRQYIKEYRQNEPGIPFRIRKYRERIDKD